jgi:RNA polymerase sigma-70 factor, ECF subfamily
VDPAWQREAIENAFIDNYSRLLTYAKKYTVSECEDLLSKTIVQALEKAEKLVDKRNVIGWLSVLMHNLYIDDYRRNTWKHQKLQKLREEIEKDLETNVASTMYEEDEAFLHLLCKLGIIVPEYFIPLYYKGLGMSYIEIKNRLNIPLGTVMSRLHRGRKLAIGILEGNREEFRMEPPEGSIAAEIVQEARTMKSDSEIADKLGVKKSLVSSTKNFWRKKGCDIPYLKVPQKRTPALRRAVPKYEEKKPEPKPIETPNKEEIVVPLGKTLHDYNLEMATQIRRRVCEKLKLLSGAPREVVHTRIAALQELVELADDIERNILEKEDEEHSDARASTRGESDSAEERTSA